MNIIVKQRDIKDCGICCIQSLIIFHGGYVSLERLRLDTCLDKDGTDAYHIVETLKKYQFQAYGSIIKNEELTDIITPCIAHFQYKNGLTHFVVLLKVNKNSVVIMDPAKGKYSMKKKDFLDLWTNVLIMAVPLSKIPKLPKEKGMFRIICHWLREEKGSFLTILWFSLLFSLCAIFLSFFYKFCFEEASGFFEKNNFFILMGIYGCFVLLKLFLENTRDNLKIILSKNIETKFIYSFLRHLFYLPISQYLSHTKGELLARIKESEQIEHGFIDILLTSFINLFLALLAFIVIFSFNQILGYILLFGIGLYFLYSYVKGKFFYQLIHKAMEEEEKWNTRLTESLELFLSMKHLNQTAFVLERIEKNLVCYLKLNYHNSQDIRRQNFWKKFILEATFYTTIIVGFYLIGVEKLSIFDFILIQSLLTNFVEPLKSVIDLMPSFYYLKGLFQKIGDFEAIDEEALDYPRDFYNGTIEFKKVCFSYDNYHQNLSNVSLKIKKEKFTLLVGPSGCGKSTICKLIHRQIDNFTGLITIKNKNILDYPVATIRKNITYLSQNEALINGTIRENIIFGRLIEEDVFDKVCDICKIEEIVSKRPFRYNDYIRVDDCNLSGGEKQRIILARTLLNDSFIYLFDEVLSEVDAKKEEQILKKLQVFLKKKTVLYITHRPNEKYFDEVIRLGN